MEARSQTSRVAIRSLAPLALMGLIFLLSAQPDLDSGLGDIDLVLRKLAHATEYGLLTLLWAWALRPATRLAVPAAAAIAVLYAISDEYHQTFVDGRGGTAVDVAIDCAGVVLALLALRYHRRLRAVPGEWRSQGP